MNRFQVAVVVKMLAIACAIIIVGGLLVHGIQSVREAAARTQTVNNLKQISLALHSFNDVYRKLPSASGPLYASKEDSKLAKKGTLFFNLLPYMESDPFFGETLKSDGKNLESEPLPSFAFYESPRDSTNPGKDGAISFAANLRVFTKAGLNSHSNGAIDPNKDGFPLGGDAKIPETFADGTARTLAIATIYAGCKPGTITTMFTSAKLSPSPFFGMHAPQFSASTENRVGQIFQMVPDPADCNPSWTPQALLAAGITCSMMDASVGTIRADISSEVWGKLQHPADGDTSVKPWE